MSEHFRPSALKPCPFCGADGDALREVHVTHFKQGTPVDASKRVKCTGCGCTAPLLNWNLRIEGTKHETAA